MIIEIKEGVFYDTEKDFKEQTDNFKDYANALDDNTVREMYPKYPEFDNDGNITYIFSDDKLDYSSKRVQVYPFSTANRSIKETIHTITTK